MASHIVAADKDLGDIECCYRCGHNQVEMWTNYFIKCHKCGLQGRRRPTQKGAVAVWNEAARGWCTFECGWEPGKDFEVTV